MSTTGSKWRFASGQRWKKRLPSRRLVLVAAGLAAAATAGYCSVLALGGTTVVQYCNQTVSPGVRCPTTPAANYWDQNTANGNQSQGNAFGNKCERITLDGNYNDIWSRRCGTNISITGYWNDSCWCPTENNQYNLRVWVENNNDFPMWLNGAGIY